MEAGIEDLEHTAGPVTHFSALVAGIVDEKFFPGPVGLSKANIQFPCPLAITLAELAVLISIGICFLVFRPEKLEGNPFLFQFLVNPPFFSEALTALGLIIQRHFTHHRGGRFGPECPADLDRNRWPICSGMGGRFESESMAGLGRNLQYIQIH